MEEEDIPRPEFPEDSNVEEQEPLEDIEDAEDIPPAPQRMPVLYAYFQDIIESKEVPDEAKQLMWPLFNRDIKLGKLRRIDEYLIHIGVSMYETALIQLKRKKERRLSWEDFVHIVGAKATEPAVISRGRDGFERTMQQSQIAASISASGQEVKKESVIGSVFARVKRTFGFGGED